MKTLSTNLKVRTLVFSALLGLISTTITPITSAGAGQGTPSGTTAQRGYVQSTDVLDPLAGNELPQGKERGKILEPWDKRTTGAWDGAGPNDHHK